MKASRHNKEMSVGGMVPPVVGNSGIGETDMDILERLRGYNPPDRTNDDHRQIAVDIQDAAAEIERLRAATEGTSTVEIDGIAYPTPPQVAGLLQAVSEERDELLANNSMKRGE